MDLTEAAAQLARTWGKKTLATFRAEAARELNGTRFETLRVADGPRLALMICLTGAHEIRKVERLIEFDEQGPPADWDSATLGELVMSTFMGSGMSYQEQRDTLNRRTAVVFIVAEPRSITIFERLFNLPP